MDLRVARQDTLDQRRAGAWKPDDEDRRIGRRPHGRLRRTGGKGFDQPVDGIQIGSDVVVQLPATEPRATFQRNPRIGMPLQVCIFLCERVAQLNLPTLVGGTALEQLFE